MPKFLKLLISIAISFSAALIGGLATSSSIPTWYADLEKPLLNPPNFVFGPVWTVLYVFIGISLYLVWTKTSSLSKRRAFTAFGVQIVLNTAWSLVFFGLQLPWVALAIIAALIAAIIWYMRVSLPISKAAAILLIPYLLWVCFATYLNLGIAMLN